ncbi:MAG TPA: SDR family oxidoreductase, partial [Lacipirellulaceae bacterium]|nr:SDR family oxidoreductase [Lacipirellulaceae bacterium]
MTSPSSPGLEGLRAVVTGSTSGIGRATAVALAAAGADVVIHGRDRDRGAEVAEAVHQWKRNAIVDVTDLSDEPALSDFVQRVWAQGRVDIWVNNAGVDVLTGEASQLDFVAKLARLWAVDVRATIMLSRDVGRRMHAAGGGVIINMGWDQASTGMAGHSGELFSGAKGSLQTFSRSPP